MARKLKENKVDPSGVDPETIKRAVAGVQETRAELSKAQMANASEWKEIKRKGIHDQALKLGVKLDEMEETQRHAWLAWFDRIRRVLDLDRVNEPELFAGDPEATTDDAIREAADKLRTPFNERGDRDDAIDISADPPAASAPVVRLAFEDTYKGKPRLIGAGRKGRDDAAAGRDFNAMQYNGLSEKQAYADGFNQQRVVMGLETAQWPIDPKPSSASDEPAPVEPETAVEGGVEAPMPPVEVSAAPGEITADQKNQAYEEGRAAFRAGKAPGAHAYAAIPVLARYFQNGWAFEQDEAAKKREAEKAAAKAGAVEVEQPAGGIEAKFRNAKQSDQAAFIGVREEGRQAAKAGIHRTERPYEAGTWQAKQWNDGYDQVADAEFANAAPVPSVGAEPVHASA